MNILILDKFVATISRTVVVAVYFCKFHLFTGIESLASYAVDFTPEAHIV